MAKNSVGFYVKTVKKKPQLTRIVPGTASLLPLTCLVAVSLCCGHQLSLPVVNCRYGSVAFFAYDRDFECVIHPNSEDITMIEFCANHLYTIYESHVFATSISDEQLIPDLYHETMIAGDPRIINHNVIVLCTADKSRIPILESVLSHGEILVFQFKPKHGAPSYQCVGLRWLKCKVCALCSRGRATRKDGRGL
jgi:hypothetical protein